MWELLPGGEYVWNEQSSNFDINDVLNEATQDEVNNYYNEGELPRPKFSFYEDIKKHLLLVTITYIVLSTKPWK
jgi:hypothetical protein